jgi:hypothetical protein
LAASKVQEEAMGLEALVYAHMTAGRHTDGYEIIVGSGDLNQMMDQKLFLQNRGFDVRNSDVYPAVRSHEDAKRALAAMWKARVSGWWNMESMFLRYSVCTAAEFESALQTL